MAIAELRQSWRPWGLCVVDTESHRLMREAGLHVRSRKRWRLVSSSRHALPIAPNHLDRQFASDRANLHWSRT